MGCFGLGVLGGVCDIDSIRVKASLAALYFLGHGVVIVSFISLSFKGSRIILVLTDGVGDEYRWKCSCFRSIIKGMTPRKTYGGILPSASLYYCQSCMERINIHMNKNFLAAGSSMFVKAWG